MRTGLTVLAAFGLAWPVAAQPDETSIFDQLWPETNVYVKLNDSSRLFFLVAGTRTKAEGYTDGQLGAHVDLFARPFFFKNRYSRHPDIARNKFLMVRLGYLFGATPPDSPKPFVEHTPTFELIPRFYFKRLLVTNRSRMDFRFIDGAFTPRYRQRLKLEGTFPVGRLSLTPYAHAEAFYDWRWNVFHRFRFSAGAEIQVARRVVLEGYYLHQIDTRSSSRNQNIVGVAIQFYLR